MAKDTCASLNNITIYQVYVRNHGPNGTFADVLADLDRIQSMGVDVVYFMPIHPIGQLNKKGSLGCPYSIRDFRAVNPEYGSEADFKALVEAIHARGMKVMIDVVYNHTAHDARYIDEHPDWYNVDAAGKPFTTVPVWSDIIDLKHPNEELWEYLVGSLVHWVQFGVDGFRCDVASLVPMDFWLRARAACAAVNPHTMWLAESVHLNFVRERRRDGLRAVSDSEVYQAFDMCYDYDIWPVFGAAVAGTMPLTRYIEMLQLQDSIYPGNFIKMRCVENHDQVRIQQLAGNPHAALAWTALAAFNRGPFFIYAGQESAARHTPSLFDVDKVAWGTYELQETLTRMAALKQEPALTNGKLTFLAAEPAIQAAWENGADSLYGVFNPRGATGAAAVQLPDGEYPDLLNGGSAAVRGGKLALPAAACILRAALAQPLREFVSPLMHSEIH
ncbi:MAG: alpha-amylase [Anaerolineae bacterium]|nr:alpha-amylase [Anaerolineae bacterium]